MKVQDLSRSELLGAVERYRKTAPPLPADWEGDFATVIQHASPYTSLENVLCLRDPSRRMARDQALFEAAPGETVGQMGELARSRGRKSYKLSKVLPWVVAGSLGAAVVGSILVPTPLAGGLLLGGLVATALGAAAATGHYKRQLEQSVEVQSRLLPWETLLGQELGRLDASRQEVEEMAQALSSEELQRILRTPETVTVGGVVLPVKRP